GAAAVAKARVAGAKVDQHCQPRFARSLVKRIEIRIARLPQPRLHAFLHDAGGPVVASEPELLDHRTHAHGRQHSQPSQPAVDQPIAVIARTLLSLDLSLMNHRHRGVLAFSLCKVVPRFFVLVYMGVRIDDRHGASSYRPTTTHSMSQAPFW